MLKRQDIKPTSLWFWSEGPVWLYRGISHSTDRWTLPPSLWGPLQKEARWPRTSRWPAGWWSGPGSGAGSGQNRGSSWCSGPSPGTGPHCTAWRPPSRWWGRGWRRRSGSGTETHRPPAAERRVYEDMETVIRAFIFLTQSILSVYCNTRTETTSGKQDVEHNSRSCIVRSVAGECGNTAERQEACIVQVL